MLFDFPASLVLPQNDYPGLDQKTPVLRKYSPDTIFVFETF